MSACDVPHTVAEAIRLLKDLLDPAELTALTSLTEDRLLDEHFGIAVFIRQAFSLWRGNDTLVAATGESHPDDAAMVILTALWRDLQAEAVPRLH